MSVVPDGAQTGPTITSQNQLSPLLQNYNNYVTNSMQNSGGGAASATPQPTAPGNNTQTTNTPQQPSIEDQIRNSINSGYGSYFNQLDQMMAGLDPERQDQENVVNNSYNTSKGDLDTQNTNSQGDLDTAQRHTMENQQNNVNTIQDQIRNMMQSGSNYLGALGAGDSSAANQYAYALTKLGSQQQGDLMNKTNSIVNDIGDRRSKLNNIYMQEMNRLNNDHGTNLANIAQWFSDAQNQLRGQKAEGSLNQGKDLASLSQNLLNAALGQLGMLQQASMNKRNALNQWAVYNSQNVPQLQANMQNLSSVQPDLPVANFGSVSPSTSGPQQTSYAPGNQLTDELKNMGVSFL